MRVHHRHPLLLIPLRSLAVLLAFEAALQIASLMYDVALARGLAEHVRDQPAAERRVLCIGDSFTFGIGSSSPGTSYPSQLQRLLNDADGQPPWRVLNFGKPGMNSWEVRRYLTDWLDRTQPAWVCLLIGMNDRWNTTYQQQTSLPRMTSGLFFPWEWKFRTGILIRLALDRNAGRLSTAEVLRQLRLVQHRLDHPAAERLLRDAHQRQPEDDLIQAYLAFALHQNFKNAEALDVIRPLVQHLLEGGRLADGDSKLAIDLLVRFGHYALARDLTCYSAIIHPGQVDTLSLLSRLMLKENADWAWQINLRARALEPNNPRVLQQEVLLLATRKQDLPRAYRNVIANFAATTHMDTARQLLYRLEAAGMSDAGLFASLLDEAGLPAQKTQSLRTAFSDARNYRERGLAGLQANFPLIVSACRQRQITLIVLSYPDDASTHALLKQLAIDSELPFVDVQAVFAEAAAHTAVPVRALLAADNLHLNDHGAEVVARAVASQVLATAGSLDP